MIDAYRVPKNLLLDKNAPSFSLPTPCLILKKLYMQAFRIGWSLMKVFPGWAGYSVCRLFRPAALHVVLPPFDGAQFQKNKKSDTSIGIWIVDDYSPDM